MAKAFGGKRPQNLRHTLRRFGDYLGHHKRKLALIGVLTSISALAALIGTYMIRPAVNGILEKETDTETLLAALKDASETYLKGILGYNTLPLVSMDFKGDPHSSILEAPYTTVQNGNLVKVVAWYDNEWGYSNRVCDLVCLMQEKGL